MKDMNYNKSILITLLAIMLFSFKLNDEQEVLDKANQYMDYLNNNKIKGGCFYIKGDSVVTFKNFK